MGTWQDGTLGLYYGTRRRPLERRGFWTEQKNEIVMAVVLRFKRMGRNHKAFFRLSAADSRCPRDGRVLEELGTYDPSNRNEQAQVKFNADRIKHWLSVGARPSDTVRRLLKKHGITK